MNKLIEYINNNFRFFECLFFFIMIFIMLTNLYLDPVIKQNIDKSQKNKPTNREKITSNSVVGNVESIHPWGRTEVVSMRGIQLEYFEYCDEWVMYGDVEQPIGRKDYFMPVLRGHLDFNVKDLTQTWVEHGKYETGSLEKIETYEDFRVADIRVKSGKIIDIKYTHYRLLSNKTWSIIASWKANVNPDAPDPIVENIQKEDVPLIVCSVCKGKGEKPTDVNKLMMDASLALFINHHLNVDKCDKCVKLPYGDAYDYCKTVQDRYQILVQEYGAAGPKISMAACEECMGMGTFSSKDLTTGKWITQEEHDEKSKTN